MFAVVNINRCDLTFYVGHVRHRWQGALLHRGNCDETRCFIYLSKLDALHRMTLLVGRNNTQPYLATAPDCNGTIATSGVSVRRVACLGSNQRQKGT